MNRILQSFLLSGFIFFVFSCKQKEVSLPLEKEKLVQLVMDMYIAESMAAHADLEVRDSIQGVYLNQVALHHNLSSTQIQDIMKALSEMPDSLYLIQGIAVDSMNARQSQEQLKDKIIKN